MSLFSVGIFSNRLVLVGIASELLMLALISYAPPANLLFGTAPLQLWHLSLSLPFALLIVAGDELRRYHVRRGPAFVRRRLTW
jgi:sodium/potassium-transporting ATPase subunit alpha